MRYVPGAMLVSFVLMGCQSVASLPVRATKAPEKPALTTTHASDDHTKKPVQSEKPASVEAVLSPSAPVEIASIAVSGEPVRGSEPVSPKGLSVPRYPASDPHASEFLAQKEDADRLYEAGSLTREAAIRRLYRWASHNGLIKGKPDEDLWQALILAYRNLDNRYITEEEAASDIAAAFGRRSAVK